MEDTSGFYKLDGELLHGPNFVYAPEFTLLKEHHAEYSYPVGGWYWFDSLEEAHAHFGITPEV